jgi:chaperonin GroES
VPAGRAARDRPGFIHQRFSRKSRETAACRLAGHGHDISGTAAPDQSGRAPVSPYVNGVNNAMPATQTTVRIRPLHDRVIVQRLEEGEQKVGGIIIPDTAKEKPQQGKVIAVGKGKVEKDGKITPLDVKEGDTILFGKYSGQEIKLDGEEYLIMREEEILGVLNS